MTGLAPLLGGAVGRFALGLGSLDGGLRLIHLGLEHDGVQLPDALEVGVVLGQQDMGHIELGNGQAVLLEAGKQLFVEGGGDLPHLLIHLQQVDLLAP